MSRIIDELTRQDIVFQYCSVEDMKSILNKQYKMDNFDNELINSDGFMIRGDYEDGGSIYIIWVRDDAKDPVSDLLHEVLHYVYDRMKDVGIQQSNGDANELEAYYSMMIFNKLKKELDKMMKKKEQKADMLGVAKKIAKKVEKKQKADDRMAKKAGKGAKC